jgi:hypothetical protein
MPAQSEKGNLNFLEYAVWHYPLSFLLRPGTAGSLSIRQKVQ